jgi:hypothetical protein
MFDEHRKFRTCIFCGSAGKRTREHIFGKSLASRFKVRHTWSTDGAMGKPIKGGAPITSITAPVLCGTCNNKTLGNSMKASQEPIWDLSQGRRRTFAIEELQSILRYWQRIGFIVDVMTSDHQLSDTYKTTAEYERSEPHRRSPPLYSEAEREQWLHHGHAPSFRLYLGHHLGVLGVNPATLIAPVHRLERGVTPISLRVVGKRFVIALGQLVACLEMGMPSVRPIPQSMALLPNERTSDWTWPPAQSVTYREFFGLADPSDGTVMMAALFSNPVLCPLLEEHTRQVGVLEPPSSIASSTDPLVRTALRDLAMELVANGIKPPRRDTGG